MKMIEPHPNTNECVWDFKETIPIGLFNKHLKLSAITSLDFSAVIINKCLILFLRR